MNGNRAKIIAPTGQSPNQRGKLLHFLPEFGGCLNKGAIISRTIRLPGQPAAGLSP